MRRLLVLVVGYLTAPLVPRRLDNWIIAALTRSFFFFNRKALAALAANMKRRLGGSQDFDRLAANHYAMRIEDMWGRIRGLHYCGWRPQIQVLGIDKLKRQLERRGAIIWAMTFCGPTVIKLGMWSQSLPITHLSRREHGSATYTRFGVQVVALFYRFAEDPYLAERIIIPLDGSLGYMKRLTRSLDERACLSIMGEHQGRQNIETPFLNSTNSFATGAPSLAWSRDAALFTAYVERQGPQSFDLIIEDEIPVNRELPRKVFVSHAVEEFARRLETHVRNRPQDWQGWLLPKRPGRRPVAESARIMNDEGSLKEAKRATP